jgi:hypothetical protein
MADDILLPVCAMAALTFLVLTLVPMRRFIATAQRKVTANDFALGESERVPADVRLPSRNLANLFEMPVLFYVVCLALYVSGHVTPTFVTLAWVYVALRTVHSLIHVTFNHVLLRLSAFALSVFVLLAMWALFAQALLAAR